MKPSFQLCCHPSIPNGSLTSNFKQTSNHILRASMPLLILSYSALRVRNHLLLAQSPGRKHLHYGFYAIACLL